MATLDERRKRTWRYRLNDESTLEVSTPLRATEKQIRRRGRVSLIVGTLLAAVALAAVALASDVDVAVVDATAPIGSVTLAPGDSGNIAINLSVTGSQAGTATFTVYRDWTLSGGAFSGANPQMFTVNARAGGAPATTFSTTGTLTVASGQANGNFTLGVGAFDITNSNATGAKLAAGDSSNYAVTVLAPPPPSDTTPPTLHLPADITAEATSSASAVVTYSATADDADPAHPTVNCSPPSGSTFALGTTTVSCSATDAHSNTANGSFTVTVRDTTPPTLTLPANITAEATGPSGAAVSYSASASDLVDGAVAVNCSPPSGSTFAPGGTTVNCSATDAAGNTANGSFNVTVSFNWAGFFQPVDNKMLNGMKAGSTAPIKWQVSDGSGGYISSLSIVANVLSGVQACSASAPVDNLEDYATGNTQLRYDSTSNQYIYNWQSPKKPGQCFQVDIVLTDGTHHVAQFQLK